METKSINSIVESRASSASHVACTDIVLPGYQFEREIGHGAQGCVYLARRKADGCQVAIKRLNIESVKNWKEYELFHREAEVLGNLHIDGVAGFFEAVDRLEDDPPCSYIVQEYISGRSLAEMLNAGIRFSLHSVYDIVLQLLNLLKQLQSCTPPVIHRDIKPSNILLEPIRGDQYKVWLIDFGAVANPQVQSGGSTIAGTFGYMPPEQLMGNPVPASDIYSLAAVIVYLLSGKSPADMASKDFYLVFEPDLQNMPHAVVQTLRRMLDPKAGNRLSDIPKLIEIWQAFSRDNYSRFVTAKLNDEKIGESEFEYKLKDVSNYCQPGNMDLWQSLGEKIPRTMPKCYTHVSNQQNTYLSMRGLFKHHVESFIETEGIVWDKDGLYKTRLLKYPVILPEDHHSDRIPLCIFVFFLILFFILMHIPNGYIFRLFFFLQLFGGTPLLLIVLASSSRPSKEMVTLKPPPGWQDDIFGKGKVANLIRQRYDKLLSDGRKTIATIVSVDYMPATDALTEPGTQIYHGYTYGNIATDPGKKLLVKENLGCSLVYHGIPKFRIQYRFNPPDDQKSEDLIHQIYLYDEPNASCKPGAVFPILYRISRDKDGTERVDSMPFPLPLAQIADLESLVYLDY